MTKFKLFGGAVHKLPTDLRIALSAEPAASKAWQNITPLARNEWICLVISAKQAETRQRRLKRTTDQLNQGKRRPCCWAGCSHR